MWDNHLLGFLRARADINLEVVRNSRRYWTIGLFKNTFMTKSSTPTTKRRAQSKAPSLRDHRSVNFTAKARLVVVWTSISRRQTKRPWAPRLTGAETTRELTTVHQDLSSQKMSRIRLLYRKSRITTKQKRSLLLIWFKARPWTPS